MHVALFLLFLLLPTYLLRFQIGPLPSTVLEVIIWIILAMWICKREHRKQIIPTLQILKKEYALLFWSTILFLLGATISVFSAVDLRAAAGEWKAFYIEPVILALILFSEFRKNKSRTVDLIILALIFCGLATSILAIYQHFTGWMVPHAFWANRNTYRVTAWYGFPNGVGLFLAPIVPLALYAIKKYWSEKKPLLLSIAIIFIPCALLAIWYAKSTGGLIGVAAAISLLLLIYKKTRWPVIIVSLISLASLVSLPSENPIKKELLLQDRSGQIRVAIWKETWQLLEDHPLRGAGLASYEERIAPYHTLVNGERIEIFHHPHNVFLTMWVNTGLIGVLGFFGILVGSLKGNFKNPAIAALAAIVVTGFVDSPYIKNDLAVLFWFVIALSTIKTPKATP